MTRRKLFSFLPLLVAIPFLKGDQNKKLAKVWNLNPPSKQYGVLYKLESWTPEAIKDYEELCFLQLLRIGVKGETVQFYYTPPYMNVKSLKYGLVGAKGTT